MLGNPMTILAVPFLLVLFALFILLCDDNFNRRK